MNTKFDKVFAVTSAFSIFLFMQPYFTWHTYPGHQIVIIFKYLNLFIGIVICFYLIIVKSPNITESKLFGAIIFFLLISFYYSTGARSQIGSWGVLAQYIFMLLFIYYNNDVVKIKIFEIFRRFFAIILIPAIIVFFLKSFGANLPYEIIYDYNAGGIRAFLHYPFSFSTLTAHLASIDLPSMRLNGPLDEPGALGTFLAVLLISTDFDLKDKYNLILFLAGCLTLSTAFFIMIAVYLILTKIPIHKLTVKRKHAYFFIAALLILAFILVMLIAKPEYFQKIWDAVFDKFFSDDLRGTAAILEQTRMEFGGNIMKYLIGNGYFSGSFGASNSWATLLHDVGIIGIILLVLYIFLIESNKKVAWNSLTLRMMMLLSVMQRPNIVSIPYVLLFTIGLINLEKQNADRNDCREIAAEGVNRY